MTRRVEDVEIEVIHLDLNVQRYTADGAVREAWLNQHPGREVAVQAPYAESLVGNAPVAGAKMYRVCLN